MAERAAEREETAPNPEDERKPDTPAEISKPSWKYIGRKTIREFSSDQCTDLAAALTYYGTLAIFPALLAFVSLLGLVGDAERTTQQLLSLLDGLVPTTMLTALDEPIRNLTQSPAAGLALVVGIVGALWSASGFVGAFSRSMNRIYSIEEGRPFWKLRPLTLLVTVLAVVFAVIVAVMLVLSGPVAEAIGEALGLGETVVFVWDIVKWPILLLLAITIIAILYYATPNIQQPKFRWMSMGAFAALVSWIVASAGFAFYVANFSSYNDTYGSIGGVIVFLLWLWISNMALLFGAELDAEIERGRELQAGIAAEEQIQLPPRDTKMSDKRAEVHAKDVRAGLALRRDAERAQRSADESSD
ncbi:MAG TPA: YihY/virulence factor BrkB family protein [Glaciihabitans sp.]|nr:YihY/virulence factor BrkB family protein [Glaciihabitans sp.]